jgi:hypothetical protein
LQPSCLHPIPCKCANAAEGSFHDLWYAQTLELQGA